MAEFNNPNNTYEILKNVLTGDTLTLASVNNTYECFQAVYSEDDNALRVNITNLTGGTVEPAKKVYKALLTQEGTDIPVATILENTLGEVPTFTYDDVGLYYLNITGGTFAETSMAISYGSGQGPNETFVGYFSDINQLGLESANSGSYGNDIFYNTLITIEVYS